jgi:hypothetical protein
MHEGLGLFTRPGRERDEPMSHEEVVNLRQAPEWQPRPGQGRRVCFRHAVPPYNAGEVAAFHPLISEELIRRGLAAAVEGRGAP